MHESLNTDPVPCPLVNKREEPRRATETDPPGDFGNSLRTCGRCFVDGIPKSNLNERSDIHGGRQGEGTSFGVPRTRKPRDKEANRVKIKRERERERERERDGAISGESQSKNSEHIFSSLEPGPGLIGPRGISVFLHQPFRPFPSFSPSLLPVCRVLRDQSRADAGSSVRGVSCETVDESPSGLKRRRESC